METLHSLEDEVNAQLVNEELNPRKKRKREVVVWLKNVQHKKSYKA